jgi:hypothetical protein
MFYNISTSLTRNLQDVFGENDPVRRRAAIDRIHIGDGVFYDPSPANIAERKGTPDISLLKLAGDQQALPSRIGKHGRLRSYSAVLGNPTR